MAMELTRIKETFANMVESISPHPWTMLQFIVWLDLKLAEYKVSGYMVLDHSIEAVPEWLANLNIDTNDNYRQISQQATNIPQVNRHQGRTTGSERNTRVQPSEFNRRSQPSSQDRRITGSRRNTRSPILIDDDPGGSIDRRQPATLRGHTSSISGDAIDNKRRRMTIPQKSSPNCNMLREYSNNLHDNNVRNPATAGHVPSNAERLGSQADRSQDVPSDVNEIPVQTSGSEMHHVSRVAEESPESESSDKAENAVQSQSSDIPDADAPSVSSIDFDTIKMEEPSTENFFSDFLPAQAGSSHQMSQSQPLPHESSNTQEQSFEPVPTHLFANKLDPRNQNVASSSSVSHTFTSDNSNPDVLGEVSLTADDSFGNCSRAQIFIESSTRLPSELPDDIEIKTEPGTEHPIANPIRPIQRGSESVTDTAIVNKSHMYDKKLARCVQCEAIFENKLLLANHKVSCAVTGYRCGVCREEFGSSIGRDGHRAIHHERSRETQCFVCSRIFGTKADLKRHMTVHDKVKPYKCNNCGNRFAYKFNLTTHQKKSCKDSRTLHCVHCGPTRTFPTTSSLFMHLQCDHGIDE